MKYFKFIILSLAIMSCFFVVNNASAATEFVSTIRATGGDYSMLSTWEAAVQSDLTASTTVVYSGTGTGGISAGATLELFRGGDYQNITALKVATTSSQLLVQTFTGDYKVLQDGDQWRVASSTDNMWTVSSAGLGDSAIAVAECYNDWPTGLDDYVTISGWTTGASNYVKVYAPEGERHNGKAKDGAGNYTGFALKSTTNYVQIFRTYTAYTIFDGLIADVNNGFRYAGFFVDGNSSVAKNCIALNATYDSIASVGVFLSGSNAKAINCLAYDNKIGFRIGNNYAGYIYNCTAINNVTGIWTQSTAFSGEAVKNCLASGNTTTDFDFDEPEGTYIYNASSDATADDRGGTGNRINQTFTFADEANDDFHLSSSDSGARNQGTDLSADGSYPITDDIDYTTRPYGGIWDIGADEVIDYAVTKPNSPQTNLLTDGLVGYWSFNGQDMDWSQTTAEARDLSGNANHGDVINGAKAAAGISGQALSFDGVDDYVLAKNGKLIADSVNSTASLWIKTTATSVAGGRALYAERAAAGNDIWKFDSLINTQSTYGVQFTHRDDAGTLTFIYATNETVINDGNWHHVAVTKSGKAIILYVDGGVEASGTLNGTDTMTITGIESRIAGDKADPNADTNGLIDEVRVYNRALSEDEIGQIYRAGARKMKIDPTKGYKTIIK